MAYGLCWISQRSLIGLSIISLCELKKKKRNKKILSVPRVRHIEHNRIYCEKLWIRKISTIFSCATSHTPINTKAQTIETLYSLLLISKISSLFFFSFHLFVCVCVSFSKSVFFVQSICLTVATFECLAIHSFALTNLITFRIFDCVDACIFGRKKEKETNRATNKSTTILPQYLFICLENNQYFGRFLQCGLLIPSFTCILSLN